MGDIRFVPIKYIFSTCMGTFVYVLNHFFTNLGTLEFIATVLVVYGITGGLIQARIRKNFWWYRLILTNIPDNMPILSDEFIRYTMTEYALSGQTKIDHDALFRLIELHTQTLQSLGCILLISLNSQSVVQRTDTGSELLIKTDTVL